MNAAGAFAASSRLGLARSRPLLGRKDDLDDPIRGDVMGRMADAFERVRRAPGMSRAQPAEWICA